MGYYINVDIFEFVLVYLVHLHAGLPLLAPVDYEPGLWNAIISGSDQNMHQVFSFFVYSLSYACMWLRA
jgi:hypothetical protein